LYSEILNVWHRELGNREEIIADQAFLDRAEAYLKNIDMEIASAGAGTLKAKLLEAERSNAAKLVSSIRYLRKRKIALAAVKNEAPKPAEKAEDAPKTEGSEAASCAEPAAETVVPHEIAVPAAQTAPAESSKTAETTQTETTPENATPAEIKPITIRFIKDVPQIVGSDLKSRGPFKTEDVAALPPELAKVMIERGLAIPLQ
jgi:DNA replication initiation complex subunit (GINS family)